MRISRVSRFIVFLLIGAVVLFSAATVFALSESELKEIATTDFVPGIRAAAAMAVGKLYLEADLKVAELEKITVEAETAQLKEAAVPALAKAYGDVSGINTSEEAQKLAKDLEKKAAKGENSLIKRAAGMALASFYSSFSLKGVEGYTTEDLEKIAKQGEAEELQDAAVEALAVIYPNIKTAEELEALIADAGSKKIKEAASKALALRYIGPFAPSPGVQELKAMASDTELDKWIRASAGDAFGQLAADELGIDELSSLAKEGETAELQAGAGIALAKVLIESEKTEQDLIKLVVAASIAETEAYQNAVIEALADRYAS